MRKFIAFVLLSLCVFQGNAFADPPPGHVLVTIRPIFYLVKGLMDGTDLRPKLLLKNSTQSPHTYAMKPSDAQLLSEAGLIFWIGESLESFLEKPIKKGSLRGKAVRLMDAPGLTLYPLKTDLYHHHAPEGSPSGTSIQDPHIWLDVQNVKKIVHYMADQLIAYDPEHRAQYLKNREILMKRLDVLQVSLEELLEPVKGKPFLIFHDGYQYFEKAFGLSKVGVISWNPERPLSLNKRQELVKTIKSSGAKCLFVEPQFSLGVPRSLSKETGIQVGTVDPFGEEHIDSSAQAYFTVMRNLTVNFMKCLKK